MPHRSRSVATVATVAVVSSALALAACSGGSTPAASSPPATSSPTATASSPATAPDVATPVSDTRPAAPQTPSPAAGSSAVTGAAASSGPVGGTTNPAPVLVLEPDGVGVVSGASIRHLPFGTDVTTITNTLTSTVGPVTRTTQTECGQGARVQLSVQGFSALMNGVSFVGWTDSGRSTPRLTTANGIGVGSPLASIKGGFAGVTVTTGTLGPEWTTPDGTLGGLLDGTTVTSRMTSFYAGETCFFR